MRERRYRNGGARRRAFRPMAVAVTVVATLAAGCTAPAEDVSSPDPTTDAATSSVVSDTSATRTAPSMDLDEAANALGDPSTAVDGVIAILDVLQIGAYETDGTPIMPGAEQDEDDLWLSMAEVSGLAQAASRSPLPFSSITELLNTTSGLKFTDDEVAEMYSAMVTELPNHPMSQVLGALGTEMRADGQISAFEGWLLWVAMTPPRPSLEGEAMASRYEFGAPTGVRAADDDCPEPEGDGSDSGDKLAQEYVGKMAGSVEGAVVDELAGAGGAAMPAASRVASWWKTISSGLSNATKIIDASKMWAIYENVVPKVDVSKVPVHEVHDSEGQTVESERTEVVATVTWKGLGPGSANCFAARALGLPPPGPVPNAGVKFMIDSVLIEHGHVRRQGSDDAAGGNARQVTDAAGQARIWYEVEIEEPKAAQSLGMAFERREGGLITAEFDFAGAFEQFLNPFGMVDAAFDAFDINVIEYPLQVVWHDPAARVTVVADLSPPWGGAAAIDLATCDGENWAGSVTLDGAMSAGGGTVEQKGDAGFEFTVRGGTGTVDFAFPVTAAMTVEDITVTNNITSQQKLTLTLPEGTGPAAIKLETTGGNQVVTGPGGTVTGSVDSWMGDFSAPITTNGSCSN